MRAIYRVFAGLSAAITVTAASADPLSFYLGADVVQLTTKVDDKTGAAPDVSGSAKATTLRVKGGAHLLDWLDAELQAVLPRGEPYSTTGATNEVKTGVFALFAKPKLNLGPASVYGLVGLSAATIELAGAKTTSNFQVNLNGGGITHRETKSGLAYGVGAQFTFARNLAASVEYTQYNKTNVEVNSGSGGLDLNVRAIGAGLTYTF